MYLQLAESDTYLVRSYRRKANTVKKHRRHFLSEEGDNPYIFLPDFTGNSKGTYIREDLLDGLTNDEYTRLMQQLAPYQTQVQKNQLSEKRYLSGRAERRQKRAARAEKKTMRVDRKAARNELIRARAKAKAEGRGGDVLGSVLDTVQSVTGSIFGGGGGGDSSGGTAPEKISFWDDDTLGIDNKIFYPSLGILIVGGAYAMSRKRKRK